MNGFEFKELDIKGCYIINSFFAEDNRGSFVKSFEKDIFANNGIKFQCNEDFISHSTKDVIRGMHFQLYHPQIKLVGVIYGKVFDVVIDLRKESDTYGKWQGVYLSSENRQSLLVPRGCAHGFLSLSNDSVVSYKCDGAYDKETDSGIRFDDSDINVDWPVNDLSKVVLNSRDKKLMTLRDFDKNCKFIY